MNAIVEKNLSCELATAKYMTRVAAIVTVVLILSILTPAAHANTVGHPVYQTTSSSEVTGYARVIQLQNSGSPWNGELLATFEHWYTNGTNVPLIIRQSTDGGNTWSTLATVYDPNGNNDMFEPALFEYPTALGSYPAGTLLLVANSIEGGSTPTENFMSWRSTDHGATWTYVNTFERGTSDKLPSTGVWEPFLYLDSQERLVCVFSDERQTSYKSQFIGEVISSDGGDTWGGELAVAEGPLQTDRPGMPSVARMGNGAYILAMEVCGQGNNGCTVHTTTSPDGFTWAYNGLGSPVETADNRRAAGSPNIVFTSAGGVSPYGSLVLSSRQSFLGSGGITPAPEDFQTLFVNSYQGTGSWSWMGAPYFPQTPNSNVNMNYSPGLLLSSDGSHVMQISSTGGGPYNDQVTIETINDGLAPFTYNYTDPFATGTDAGWVDYGGNWSVSGNTYQENSGVGANKAVAGPTYWVNSSTYWTNYNLAGDVMLRSTGQGGFLVRASNPSTGTDTLNGYYAAIENTSGTLFFGKENGSWTELGRVSIPGGVLTNTWYHITVSLNNSTITITVQPSAGGTVTTLVVTDSSFPWGAIGVRDFNTVTSWRNITVN